MKTIQMLLLHGIIWSVFASCTVIEKDEDTYQTSDLSGWWAGDVRYIFEGGVRDGLDTTGATVFTFNADGSVICPNNMDCNGKLWVEGNGEIYGTIIVNYYSIDYGLETIYQDWSGSYFKEKDVIELDMVWSTETYDPASEGTQTVTGTIYK